MFVSTTEEQFEDHYMLTENEAGVLELQFRVESSERGITLSISPIEDDTDKDTDKRLVMWIIVRSVEGFM